ncbi:MAG: glycosyltransferase family 4 protein [Candidatus Magasanikbacteria bacterium]|jgi:glycosyltransferase involved in cell wall biosynthesis
MRIAMIGQKGIPAIYGGVERHVEDLSRELVKQGHDVLVYARAWYTSKALKNYHGVKIVHTPAIHTKHLDAISHTFTATLNALRQNCDVIHYHGVGPSLLAWIPRIFSPKTKVIVTFHCIDRYHQKWGAFAKFILSLGEKTACTFAHQTIAVSKTIQSYCLNEYHTKTDYIPNGVVVSKNNTASLLEKYDLKPNKYILMVSRLVRHKGVHYLLEAWQMARQQYPELLKDYKLAIVGGSTFTDDYVDDLHYIARGDKSIVFTNWLHGQILEEIYANCALYINPSENEGMPITVLQAMAYSKPVLLSDIPEHKELISDRNFLFHNASIVDLADKIIKLIKNEELRTTAGIENKALTKKSFNWGNLSKQTLAVYSHKEKIKAARLKTARA